MYFFLAGFIFVAVFSAVLDNQFKDNQGTGYSILGIIIAVIFALFPLVEVFFCPSVSSEMDSVRQNVPQKKTKVKTPFLSKLRSIATKPFFLTSAVSASLQCAVATVQIYSLLFLEIVIQEKEHFIWMLLSARIAAVIAGLTFCEITKYPVIIWTKLAVRMSAKVGYITSTVISAVGLSFAQIVPSSWLWAQYVSVIVGSFGSGGTINTIFG